VSLQKTDLLIHDLILTETWINKIFPKIKADLIQKNSLLAYFLVEFFDLAVS
jgi:hypothetical protein